MTITVYTPAGPVVRHDFLTGPELETVLGAPIPSEIPVLKFGAAWVRYRVSDVVAWRSGKLPKPNDHRLQRQTQDVYFIQAGGPDGPIKIGISYEVARRLYSLQRSNPLPLKLLATVPGGARLERELHERFAAQRLHGEWFRCSDELFGLALQLRKGIAT